AAEAEHVGGCVGEVHNAVLCDGAAVVDANDDGLVIAEVRDLDHGAHGQAAVGAGHGVHVEVFAAGRLMALKDAAVPGGAANLVPVVTRPGVGRGLDWGLGLNLRLLGTLVPWRLRSGRLLGHG